MALNGCVVVGSWMWNKQLALNDVAGQTDAWLCGQQGRSVKPLGFYTITKTLSKTRGIVCRCQKSSLLIIHHVLTLLQDYCTVMGHLSVYWFLFPFLSVDCFSQNALSCARQTYCKSTTVYIHSSYVLSVGVGIWDKLSVFMEYWHEESFPYGCEPGRFCVMLIVLWAKG